MPMFSKTIENGKSKYIFELSVPTLISLVGTVALCLVWSFILGIILGRGHSPEDQMPQLAQILPQQGSNQAPVVVEHNPDGGIMRPEELQFRESLRENQPRDSTFGTATAQSSAPAPAAGRTPGPVAPVIAPVAPAIPVTPVAAVKEQPASTRPAPQQSTAVNQALAQMERQSKPAAQANGKPAAAPAAATAKPAPAAPVASAAPVTPVAATAKPSDSGSVKYNYVYQVAASRDEKQAAAVVQKLASLGLQGRIERQGDDGWCRILVGFTGTPDDTQKLRDTVAKIGIDRIIMRDKKEVAKR